MLYLAVIYLDLFLMLQLRSGDLSVTDNRTNAEEDVLMLSLTLMQWQNSLIWGQPFDIQGGGTGGTLIL